MMIVEWLPNALLVAIALVCAGHFPEGRREAIVCACLIAADWLEFVLAWTPYSLHFALKAAGIPLANIDIWMLTDAFAAALVVAIGLDRLWVGVLWSCLAAQVVAHGFRAAALHGFYVIDGIGFDEYSRFLDWTFWCQILCFVVIGGPHVVDRIYRIAGRIRHALYPPATARRTGARAARR